MVKLRVIKKYHDIELEKKLEPGYEFEVPLERAKVLLPTGFVEIVKIEKLK
jgi:hypothetical protein